MDRSRRSFLSLIGLAAAAAVPLHQASAQQFNLGHIWQVREYEPDGTFWDGTWTRRGNSPVFDAQWRYSVNGAVASDVIEFCGVRGDGTVVLYRYRYTGTYYGHVARDGTRIRRGTTTFYNPGSYSEAEIF